MMGMKKIEVFKHVIARRERSDRRGNPSCLGKNGGVCGSLIEGQWIATGSALAMTKEKGRTRKRGILPKN
jgi:hypothetical protein